MCYVSSMERRQHNVYILQLYSDRVLWHYTPPIYHLYRVFHSFILIRWSLNACWLHTSIFIWWQYTCHVEKRKRGREFQTSFDSKTEIVRTHCKSLSLRIPTWVKQNLRLFVIINSSVSKCLIIFRRKSIVQEGRTQKQLYMLICAQYR